MKRNRFGASLRVTSPCIRKKLPALLALMGTGSDEPTAASRERSTAMKRIKVPTLVALSLIGQGIAALVLALSFASLALAQEISAVDLGTLPGGDRSFAVALNDHGQIVGISNTNVGGSDLHWFFWEQGVMVDLGPAGFGFN